MIVTAAALGSAVLEAGVLARLLERLARAAHAHPGATTADELALDVASRGAALSSPGELADALRVGCSALGLRACRVDGTLDQILGGVDPSRPVVGLAETDGRPGFVVLESRVGRGVRVDRPGAAAPVVESVEQLAVTLVADGTGRWAWIVLDVGVPHHDGDAHAGHGHDTHGPARGGKVSAGPPARPHAGRRAARCAARAERGVHCPAPHAAHHGPSAVFTVPLRTLRSTGRARRSRSLATRCAARAERGLHAPAPP